MNNKLFSKNQILISSVFGTCFVSFTLIILNLQKINKRVFELKYVAIGVVPFLFLSLYVFIDTTYYISHFINSYVKNIALIIINLLLTAVMYKIFLKDAFNKNLKSKNENWLKIILVIIIFWVLFFGITTGFVYYRLEKMKKNQLNLDLLLDE